MPIDHEKIHGMNSNKPAENNHIFRIEEDENAKEFAYHLNDNDLDEDEGYIDDSDEEERESQSHKNENKEEVNNDKQDAKNDTSIDNTKRIDVPSVKDNSGNDKLEGKTNIEMRDLNGENKTNSTNDNSKSEIKTSLIESVEEDPDPSQICHRILYKVYTFFFFFRLFFNNFQRVMR